MNQLVWSRPAVRDLYRIAADYGAIDVELSALLLQRIEDAPLPLLEFPAIGSPVGRHGLRKWPVRKTPFILFYTIGKSRIEIRRVVASTSDWSVLLR